MIFLNALGKYIFTLEGEGSFKGFFGFGDTYLLTLKNCIVRAKKSFRRRLDIRSHWELLGLRNWFQQEIET